MSKYLYHLNRSHENSIATFPAKKRKELAAVGQLLGYWNLVSLCFNKKFAKKEFAAGGQPLGYLNLVSQCFNKKLIPPLSVRCQYTLYVKGWY